MDVLVIGGGASGMMAAISAASNGANVTLYERNSSLGKKILSTGNGKCNITNRDLRVDYYNSNDDLLINNYFDIFDSEDTISTFRSFGLLLKDRNGYIYPACEQAIVVRDILINQLEDYEVKYLTNITVKSISKSSGRFTVETDNNTTYYDKVILSCGSYAGLRKTERVPSEIDGYSLAYHLGHKIIPVKPALTQILCKDDFCKELAGVRCEALITLTDTNNKIIGSEFGELQLTEYGVSGIPAFQLSRYVAREKCDFNLVVDFMPGVNDEEFIQMMQGRILSYQGATIKSFFLGLLNNKINDVLIRLVNLNLYDSIDESTNDALIEAVSLIKCFKFTVKGTKSFENAQCCSGGIPLSEIDENCQSIICPGLYITGEMLDIDGKCGGYNLQWAWTSGYIAGKAAGRK